MTGARNQALEGAALMALGSVLFGTTGVFVAGLAGMPFPALLAYRFILGVAAFGALLVAVPSLRRMVQAPRIAWPHLLGLGVLLLQIDLVFYLAIQRVGAGLAAILLYTAPLFVVILSALFLKERPTPRVLGGLALGFAGVLLIVRPGAGDALWTLIGLTSGIGWAAWLVVSRAAGARGVSGETQSLASQMVGLVLCAPVALALAPVLPSGREWALLGGLGFFASTLSLVFVAQGLHRIDANRAAVFGYLEPLTAVVLGALLLGERYGFMEAAGSVLVLVGTGVVTLAPPARGGEVPPRP